MIPRVLPLPGHGLALRVVDALGGRIRAAVPAADPDGRDPDDIRDNLPGLWLLATMSAAAASSSGAGGGPAAASPPHRLHHHHEVAAMEPQPPDPAHVAALIAGVDDTTLEDQITERGVDTVLAQIFEEMARRFLPFRAPGRTAVIQYDLRLRDGSVRTWQVIIAGGSCAVAPGADRAPQVTAEIALPRFMRLLTGALDPVVAFLRGDLRVRGDVMLAQQMQGWFDRAV